MNKALDAIQEKVNLIQSGLLRFRRKGKAVSLPVKAACGSGSSFDCITEEDVRGLRDQEVCLIQKYKDDYIYIAGKVGMMVRNKKTVISILILRACWFVRQSDGSLTWLQEKQVYDPEVEETLRLAS